MKLNYTFKGISIALLTSITFISALVIYLLLESVSINTLFNDSFTMSGKSIALIIFAIALFVISIYLTLSKAIFLYKKEPSFYSFCAELTLFLISIITIFLNSIVGFCFIVNTYINLLFSIMYVSLHKHYNGFGFANKPVISNKLKDILIIIFYILMLILVLVLILLLFMNM